MEAKITMTDLMVIIGEKETSIYILNQKIAELTSLINTLTAKLAPEENTGGGDTLGK